MRLTIYCPKALRGRWPYPLRSLWYNTYPHLFDKDDLRLARHQPHYHFVEWFAAIHLSNSHGVSVLLSKYLFDNHPRKQKIVKERVGIEGFNFLRSNLDGQPPDLFVYDPKGSRYWFAEVKGPGDKVRPNQAANQRKIIRRFGVEVDLMSVRYRSFKHR